MAILTFSVALNRLKRLAATDTNPVLGAADLADILEASKVVDRYGVLPIYAGWESTYDMDRAAAEAWEAKAALASGSHDFTADGSSYAVSQVIAHCQAQAANYRRKMVSSAGGYTHSQVVGNG